MADDPLDRLTNRKDLEQRLEEGAKAEPVPLFLRFIGIGAEKARALGQLVTVQREKKHAVALGVMFASSPPALDTETLTRALRAYDPECAGGAFEVEADASGFLGLAGWGDHVIRIVGVNGPMPPALVEATVRKAHYAERLKEPAFTHKAHAILFSEGRIDNVLEEYAAVAAVCGVLADHGAVIVANETARTSLPASALAKPVFAAATPLAQLRKLPPLILYCGLVKYGVEGTPGTWMRSYGAHVFGIPDLAVLAPPNEDLTPLFALMNDICAYHMSSGKTIAAGHTGTWGNRHLRFRKPLPSEYFLESAGELLVMEPVAPSEVH
jgi:hypothetical protein